MNQVLFAFKIVERFSPEENNYLSTYIFCFGTYHLVKLIIISLLSQSKKIEQ